MKIQYQIFEIKSKGLLAPGTYSSDYNPREAYITVLEPYFGLNSFDSIEESVQHLSTLEKGKYTILTVYENQ